MCNICVSYNNTKNINFFIAIESITAHADNHYSDGADAREAAHKLTQLIALTDLDKL